MASAAASRSPAASRSRCRAKVIENMGHLPGSVITHRTFGPLAQTLR
jgi:hypothetical protein